MLVTGLESFFIIAEIQNQLIVRHVAKSADYLGKLLPQLICFWASVECNIQPEMSHISCEKLYELKLLGLEEVILERPDLQCLIEKLKHYKENKKLIEKEISGVEEELKSVLSIGEKVRVMNDLVVLNECFVKTVDVKRLKEEEPLIFKKYVIERPRRTLQLTGAKYD